VLRGRWGSRDDGGWREGVLRGGGDGDHGCGGVCGGRWDLEFGDLFWEFGEEK
jgi:hypothetical protein